MPERVLDRYPGWTPRLCRDCRGTGAGQRGSVAATEIAIAKARRMNHETGGAALASDGFFPCPDSIRRAREAGVRLVVQPGGSIRDREVLAEANRGGVAMVLTGTRHFRH